jgi:N-acetylglucosaminyldiphosphoundecaprenol N-acetyl-beta-D-mannosaminyltransferase
MRKDLELRSIIEACDLINADGMPIVWASKLLKQPLPCRVAGVDLFQHLVRLCAEKGYRPFFFGAREWVVRKVVEVFAVLYPNLHIAGFRNGYFNPDEEPQVAADIRESKADVLFVGFSSPKKERFLRKWMPVMEVPFCMGVGGSFDIIAGRTKRAPNWMQRSGLEWFYRFLQEPHRLWKRYLVTNTLFGFMVLKEILKGRSKRSAE